MRSKVPQPGGATLEQRLDLVAGPLRFTGACADRRRPHPGRLRLNDPSMKQVAILLASMIVMPSHWRRADASSTTDLLGGGQQVPAGPVPLDDRARFGDLAPRGPPNPISPSVAATPIQVGSVTAPRIGLCAADGRSTGAEAPFSTARRQPSGRGFGACDMYALKQAHRGRPFVTQPTRVLGHTHRVDPDRALGAHAVRLTHCPARRQL